MLKNPDFDSGWLSLSPGDKEIVHSLNTSEVLVYMTGRKALEKASHQMEYGGFVNTVGVVANDYRGVYWHKLTPNSITIHRHGNDENWEYVRVLIWKIQES